MALYQQTDDSLMEESDEVKEDHGDALTDMPALVSNSEEMWGVTPCDAGMQGQKWKDRSKSEYLVNLDVKVDR